MEERLTQDQVQDILDDTDNSKDIMLWTKDENGRLIHKTAYQLRLEWLKENGYT